MAISVFAISMFPSNWKRRVAQHVIIVPTNLLLRSNYSVLRTVSTHTYASYVSLMLQNRIVPHLTTHRLSLLQAVYGWQPPIRSAQPFYNCGTSVLAFLVV
jgi:hypothetical protein